jgi:hypothetical protein
VGLATNYRFCLKCAVLSLLDALSDEMSGHDSKFEVILRTDGQSVSQSVCLGVEHPCGTCDKILFPVCMLLSEICVLVSVWRPL